MKRAQDPVRHSADSSPNAARGARIALLLLLAVYILNFIDRQVINILAESIRLDLGLTDTELGLLLGPAFAVLYGTIGFPVARLADHPRSDRIKLMAGVVVIWSLATMACGLARNFVQLFVFRMAVAVGEAGCTPLAHSLIGETVPADKRPGAIAVFGLGIPLGILIGMAGGGWLNHNFGWQVAFLLAGMPGLLLAPILLLVLKDPRRSSASRDITDTVLPSTAIVSLKEMISSRGYLLILGGSVVINFVGTGTGVWSAVFLIRIHGLGSDVAGLWLGLVAGLAGLVGTLLGGMLANHYGARDVRHVLTAPALAAAISIPFAILGYLAGDWRVAVVCLGVPHIASTMAYGPTFALVQGLVSPHSRATAIATKLMIQTLVGLGLGPLTMGIASDCLAPRLGAESIRYVLIGTSCLSILTFAQYWMARNFLKTELHYLRENTFG